jgi:formamidopyrimidine-DNA glycosylase
MPELPEVETVRKTLEALVLNKEIENVSVFWPKIVKHPEEVRQFADALKGQTFEKIARRGKFLILYTETFALVSHLRMEGKYGLFAGDEPVDSHTHVIFYFTDGTQLRYRDVRKFGTMHLFSKGMEFSVPPLAGLGPEPFSPQFTSDYLRQKFAATTRKIKAVLLDQSVVAGLGNIYVDEVLFLARIHPEIRADALTGEEVERIRQKIVVTLSEAVKKGGSTIRSYVNSQGQIGMFQLELKVYGKEGEPCETCGNELKKIKVVGRGTHFCPVCQGENRRI